ncbi:aldehyde dehydrogenase family protein [Paracoccus lutimaris]|uniref:Aldehyde dehydrogenase family protein n=1 Tax=Paracoccus lutimaris TaxID=1490030 RepID=A0A368Z446_9RHOB|nr:aldehyde dehydrogenase family protein [Paracoccus lutimaris]
MNAPLPQTDPALILDRQRAAFLRDGAPSLDQRRADLKKLRKAIIAARPRIEAAISADFGHRSRHETAMAEILSPVQGIDYLHRRLPRFMQATRRHVAATFWPGSARIEYQPLGVIGIVAPWNYPLALALMPLATALAAGNRAMIKPSEFTPQTSALLAELLAQIFPPEQVAVIQGDAATGAAFTALPFDHLLFTGSTQVGRAVMRAASDNLVPVTLELGGKSPTIIAPGHVDDRTAASIAFGKLTNAGQTCIAPDYVLLHEDDRDAFAAAYDRAVTALYPQGPASADYSSIINPRHHARLTALAEDARAKGARVTPVGRAPLGGFDPSPYSGSTSGSGPGRRHGGDDAGNLWPDSARADLSRHRSGHRLCECPSPAAGALLFRPR